MTSLNEKYLPPLTRSVRDINRSRREHDFVEACRSLLSRPEVIARKPSASRIVEMVLAGSAPSYYVSLAHASARVQAMMNHPLPLGRTRNSMSHLLWMEIFQRTSSILNSRRWISLDRAVALVLERGNASSFFMSRQVGVRIFRKHFRRKDIYEESRRPEHDVR